MIAEIFDISLLAIIFSPKYAKSYWNPGFLSALADNIGRALGNSLITIAGADGINFIPNNFYTWNVIMYSIFFAGLIALYQ